MEERTKQAFQSVNDSFKQMMTLSTGVLTLEITFLKDIIKNLSHAAYLSLGLSWFSFLISLLAGIAGLLAITGSLSKTDNLTPASVYGTNIRFPAMFQVIFFGLGMFFTVVFGIFLLCSKAHAETILISLPM
jgi:hypothetical protein